MAIKDAMLVLRTYPTPTTDGFIASSVGLAERLGCRISILAPEILIRLPSTFLGNVLIDIPGMAACEMGKSAQNASVLVNLCSQLAEKRGIPHEMIKERAPIGEISLLIAEYGRLKDLIILPALAGDFVDQWDREAVIFNSARPVVLMPEGRTLANAALKSVGVAWDYSRPAARAVADAMPILERAETVHVVTVLNEKVFDITRKTHEIGTYLARHNVNVEIHEIDAAGQHIGRVLEDFANKLHLDLLVMGAYAHSRLRELVLGGATRSMLAKPPVPLLLSH
ncbi:universal stress protein [Bradyrhizobium sp. SYSU BS000235]|uniref:universal stress protein n=1 Tax=Bradyrhizobium sp. SYSU BS000235 TaxID=3411332 RepID=UPI003C72B977